MCRNATTRGPSGETTTKGPRHTPITPSAHVPSNRRLLKPIFPLLRDLLTFHYKHFRGQLTSTLKPAIRIRQTQRHSTITFHCRVRRYSDSLRAGRSVDRIPVAPRFFRNRPDRQWGPPSLLYNGYRAFSRGVAAESGAAGRGVALTTHPN